MSLIAPEDRALLVAAQAGIPICSKPFARIAALMSTTERDVLAGFERLIESGVVRRIAAAPNHFKLGMTANGMSVWDVDDEELHELGARVGALDFVTHCYQRPRALPLWPYNLFAMVHGQSREEVEGKRIQIAAILGSACRTSDILYSKRILKKSGMRLSIQGA